MRRTKRSKSKIIVGILSSIVLALTIGYSFLSLNLRISGLAHIGAVWNIHFDNIQINPDSVSLSVGDSEPEIDENNDCKINYKVTLTPGDFYEFTFDIVNDGTIDGMIQNMITRIEEDATSTFPSYIDYNVSYSDDVVLETNQQLLSGTTETLKVKVEFKNEENVPQSETLDLSYESNYVKKTNAGTKVKHPEPLYNVLQDEANSGSSLAIQYTGQHHDSFTEEPSKNIYHWYGSNNTNGTMITNKNNVIFANHCWQMLRTTDTGGVKLIYNGEVENSQCLDTRGNHVGYSSRGSQYLASNYWYGTDYSYNTSTHKFSLAGTTEQTTWSDSTYEGLIGKYTCKSSIETGTCDTIYWVYSKYNSSSANVIPLDSNSNYSQFGISGFNSSMWSMAYLGYMYGTAYSAPTMTGTDNQNFTTTQTLFSSISFNTSYKYSKTINNTGSGYELVNPILGSDIPEDTYAGYYTFRSDTTTSGTDPYYVLGLHYGSNYYSLQLSSTNDLSSFYIMVGDSISDKLDGTYELTGTTVSISPMDWYTNYANYKNKYTCGDASTTICANPRYIQSTSKYDYAYLNAAEKIMIGKTRNGVTLTDTALVRKDELVKNSSNYSDYKYTCNSDNATCTEATLRIIDSFTTLGYKYAPNRYYGTGVTWDGTNYTLVNPIEIENYNNLNNISTHHYTCVDYGLKTCSTAAYIYYTGGLGIDYIALSDGVLTIAKAIESMITKNINSSLIKRGVEAWYKHYLYDNYDQYIEDTIFCNNRTITRYGGWDENGGMTNVQILFNAYETSNALSCTNLTDQFCVSNSNAPLTYKVGLMTSSEMLLLNNIIIRKKEKDYWLASPYTIYSGSHYARGKYVDNYGSVSDVDINKEYGVRPAISLIPGIMYTDGDGSKEHPYIIKTN